MFTRKTGKYSWLINEYVHIIITDTEYSKYLNLSTNINNDNSTNVVLKLNFVLNEVLLLTLKNKDLKYDDLESLIKSCYPCNGNKTLFAALECWTYVQLFIIDVKNITKSKFSYLTLRLYLATINLFKKCTKYI
jgi:hypothetical protein